VVADVFLVPDGTTGRAKWAYAVDLGGNVWRISGATANEPFGATAPSNTPGEGWTITRIASLGCDTDTTSCSNKRKFMNMPDVVLDSGGVYHVLLGSGDREKPLLNYANAYATTNYFFALKDSPADPCWLAEVNDNGNCSGTVPIDLGALAEIDVATATEVAQAKGWYLPLNDHEQVVTTAITVYGVVTFSTHTPEVPVEGSCSTDLGTARVYNIRYYDATPKAGNRNRSAIIDGGGLPPSPVAGMVKLDGEPAPVPFLIGGGADSPLEGGEPAAPSSTTLPKSLTYWFIHK
jgi:type IV pilus assembly protein PilY1